jgi:hypothetical protein
MANDLSQSRSEREKYWLERLNRSSEKYIDAVVQVRALMGEQLSAPSASFALCRALQLETAARKEYTSKLKVFIDLVIENKLR